MKTPLKKLTADQRRQAIDLGIGAVVENDYRDGFFHADLHPANLMVFKKPGSKEISVGLSTWVWWQVYPATCASDVLLFLLAGHRDLRRGALPGFADDPW